MHTFRSKTHLMLAVATLTVASCTVSKTPAPLLTGPSELSLSLVVSAKPDILTANGSDYSDITITAFDANGQRASGRDFRVDTVNGNDKIIQVGTLSTQRVTTDASGQATVRFIAPMENNAGVDNNDPAVIRVLPMGSDAGAATARYVTVRLVPKSIIVVPGAPIADFKFDPASPLAGDTVFFDASKSYDPDGSIVRYTWNWDDADGSVQRTVPTESHDFAVPRTYVVKLTVTDNAGQESSVYKEVVVK